MIRGTSPVPNIPGLVNFGNTCYANALLQALASCESYVEYVSLVYKTLPVRNGLSVVRVSEEIEWQARMPLLRAVSCCLQRLQPTQTYESTMLASALEVLHAIGYHNHKLFTGDGEQQDVAEVLDCVISSTRTELNAWQKVHLLSPTRDLLLSGEETNRRDSTDEVEFSGILMNTALGPRGTDSLERQTLSMVQFQSSGAFEGLLSHHLECRECHHIFDVQLNRFTSLMLPITRIRMDDKEFRVEDGLTIEDCLEEYFSNKVQGPIACPRCSFYCTLTSVTKSDFSQVIGRGRRSESSKTAVMEERSSFEEEINNFTPFKRSGLADIIVPTTALHPPMYNVASTRRRASNGGGVVYRGTASFDLKEFQNNSLKPRKSDSFLREAAAKKAIHSAYGCSFRDHHVLNFQRTFKEGGINWISVDSPVNARISVSKLPKVLALSLQRKVFGGMGYRKILGRVKYPLILNLVNYLQHKSVHCSVYKLKAVIVHYGDETGGHYLTVRSVTVEGKTTWILASDDKVQAVSENAALGLEASLLLYEREPDEEKNTKNQEAPVFVGL